MNDNDFISRKAALNVELRTKVDIPFYKMRTIKAAEGAVESAVAAYVEHLRSIPAADVVKVVRCKECKLRDFCRTSTTWAVPPKDDWFCADGKRSTE